MDPFDLVRRWFEAFNRGDVDALLDLYHEDCLREQDQQTWRGRDAQRQAFEGAFADVAGAFAGGARRKVRSIGRVETGAVHAEWTGRERRSDTGDVLHWAGDDEFIIDGDRIRWQRSRPRAVEELPEDVPAPPEQGRASRQYPSGPIVGVGAVILDRVPPTPEARIVLVKRRFEPLAGQWSLPGGRIELGETLEAGLAREMLEETALEITVGPVIEVFDRILLDENRQVRYHYVLIDYLCWPSPGRLPVEEGLQAGSDVAEAVWAAEADLERYHLTEKADEVARRGVALARETPVRVPEGGFRG